jgi:cytochrome b
VSAHWTLVAGVLAAALTGFVIGATSLTWHLIAGVAVMAAVVWRVIWGLFGPTYARFTSFAYRAGAVRVRPGSPDPDRRSAEAL